MGDDGPVSDTFSDASGAPPLAAERRGWLELFFDLVVVAAIAVLAAGLEEDPTWAGLGLFLVVFAALWLTWVNVVTYADLAGAGTPVKTVVVAMMLVAVMAAAAPGRDGGHPTAFAIAFLICRALLARGSLATGKVLTSWPLLQYGGFTLPWIVSLWVPAPGKYWLWALGVAVDLIRTLRQKDPGGERALARVNAQAEQERRRAAEAARRGRRPRVARFGEFEMAELDHTHLEERLGVFIIIVLGEAIAQMVATAAGTEWDPAFLWVVGAGALLLVGLWQLTFAFGFAAAPGARLASLPPRFGMPLHLGSTLGVLGVAVGLGTLARHPDSDVPHLLLWMLCGGLALHLLVGTVAAVALGAGTKARRRWIWQVSAPSVVAALVVGAVAPLLAPVAVVWLLVAIVGWQYLNAARVDALVGRFGVEALDAERPPPPQ